MLLSYVTLLNQMVSLLSSFHDSVNHGFAFVQPTRGKLIPVPKSVDQIWGEYLVTLGIL